MSRTREQRKALRRDMLYFMAWVLALLTLGFTLGWVCKPAQAIEIAPSELGEIPDVWTSPKAPVEVVQDEQPEQSDTPAMTKLGTYKITGYVPGCEHCCGKWAQYNLTASGTAPTLGITVAMSDDIPFGTEIFIGGLGLFVVEDRGVSEGVIDIALGSHEECYAVTGEYEVWTYVD